MGSISPCSIFHAVPTGARNVLVVTMAPGDRPSARSLDYLVDALRRAGDTRVDIWYLHDPDDAAPPDAKVVDSLRTWKPAAWLAALGLQLVAGRLRGWRLRRWAADLRPDVVVLDDGFGARLLSAIPGRPSIVIRLNDEPAPLVHLESAPRTDGDMLLVSMLVPDGDPSLARAAEVVRMSSHLGTVAMADELRRDVDRDRAAARPRWGVPDEVPVIVGWGDDGWIHGGDLFVRALWHLEHQHGMVVHGVWAEHRDVDVHPGELMAEAERCGVADRLHLVDDVESQRWAGDAVFLPYRYPLVETDLMPAAIVAMRVVVFEPVDLHAPWITTVPYLDLDAAAAALAVALDARGGALAWSDDYTAEAVAARLLALPGRSGAS
jgi:hypothetical protein